MPAGAEGEKEMGGRGEIKCHFSDFRALLFLVVLRYGLCLGWILSSQFAQIPLISQRADSVSLRWPLSSHYTPAGKGDAGGLP